MATVITNLLSAIPWVGTDIVESKNITEYGTIVATALVLPTIGTVSPHALKKGNKKIRLDKKEYLSISPSFLAFFAGLIDGDGYIQVTRTTKGFITIKLVISLHLEDISTLEYIRSVLKIGKLTVYRDLRSPCCKLIINRTDLQEVLFPLLIHHGIFFLTETRKAQFDLAMFILKNDKKVYAQIPAFVGEDIPTTFELPKTASDYVNLAFFKNWIVGFKAPSKYPGVVEFVEKNPLIYKRVKADYKKICSNRDSYSYLKSIFKQQNKNVKYYSTYVKKNTEIVVWGTNLSSTVGTGRLTKIEKNMIVLPFYQKSVIIGILLSDGHLASGKPHENPRLEFKQSLKKISLCFICFFYTFPLL